MTEKMGDVFQMMQKMQTLTADQNFRAFLTHPKVKALMQTDEIKKPANPQDYTQMFSHAKFKVLIQDPEVAGLLFTLDLQKFLKG